MIVLCSRNVCVRVCVRARGCRYVYHACLTGRDVAQTVNVCFPIPWPEFEPLPGHVGFVVNKTALGQDSSEYFVSPANCSTGCSTFIIIRYRCNRPVMYLVILESVLLHLKMYIHIHHTIRRMRK
jgi:hypothetical protein